MPSLFRFVMIVAILAAIVYGAMLALVTFVQPQEREITQTLPPSRFK